MCVLSSFAQIFSSFFDMDSFFFLVFYFCFHYWNVLHCPRSTPPCPASLRCLPWGSLRVLSWLPWQLLGIYEPSSARDKDQDHGQGQGPCSLGRYCSVEDGKRGHPSGFGLLLAVIHLLPLIAHICHCNRFSGTSISGIIAFYALYL